MKEDRRFTSHKKCYLVHFFVALINYVIANDIQDKVMELVIKYSIWKSKTLNQNAYR